MRIWLEMPLEEDIVRRRRRSRRKPFRCRARWCRILSETAILLDIDGTLLDLMPTPREVWVPPGLVEDA